MAKIIKKADSKKKTVRKQARQSGSTRIPTPSENPPWLFEQATGKAPDPPAVTRGQVLPFAAIEWKDFERICVKLAGTEGLVEAAWSYGTGGQAQYGIDILVRTTDGAYEVWQTKRYRTFSAKNVEAAVEFFLSHKWAAQAKRFVLAVGCELDKREVVEAIEAARDILSQKNISFDPRGATRLTADLRKQPELIDDFFDRPWVKRICSAEAIEELEQRYSRFEEAALREKLRACYRSWIAAVDPGWLVAVFDTGGQPRVAVPITERYVKPDLFVKSQIIDSPPAEDTLLVDSVTDISDSPKRDDDEPRRDRDIAITHVKRVGLNEYLASKSQLLVVAEAGAGKSSLLRYIALDLLAENPVLKFSHGPYAGALPIWVSFALWARMAASQPRPPTVEEATVEFFKALDETGLADALKRAVTGGKIVLLVDGLDEVQDATVSQTIVALLTAFSERRGVPVIATSRPHGVRNVGGFGGNWERVELAPLSDLQQYELAHLWFRLLEAAESGVTGTQMDMLARRKTDTFIQSLKRNPGITRLSQTPLFFLAFMDLHRLGHSLPTSRFAASREIVAQLMEHQPRRRDVSALATSAAQMDSRLRDRIIADFAFALQSGGLSGAVPDAASEEDAVTHGAKLVLSRQGDNDIERAEATARMIFSFTEERAGLLVKKTPQTVGFLHLSLQEFLAARHLRQRSLEERIAFVSQFAAQPRWRETILYLLSMIESESEVGKLVEAIENAPVAHQQESAVRDELLTEAVFSDLSHDLTIVRRLALRLLEEIELTAYGARQRRLLAAAVDGLSSESLRDVCLAKLREWIPDRHGYYREGAIRGMAAWKASLKPSCEAVLFRCLRSDNVYIWRAAAETLPSVSGNSQETKARLLKLAKNAPSVDTANAAFVALGRGWHNDGDIGSMAAELRSSGHPGLQTDAIRVRARRGETDDADLDAYCELAFAEESHSHNMFARDLADHFANHHRDAFAEKLERNIRSARGERIFKIAPMLAALVLCDPCNQIVQKELPNVLSGDWVWHELFVNLKFPFDRVVWTDELKKKVEFYVGSNKQYREHELYWISRAIKLPILKERFLDSLRTTEYHSFWASKALAESWGKDDAEVREVFTSLATGSAKAIGEIAEELPLIVEDRTLCRDALLRGLLGSVERYDFLLGGCKNLGVTETDEELVRAALAAGSKPTSPLYYDMWCDRIIRTFPRHPEVRKIALRKITERDAPVGAIAECYAADEEVCRQLLQSIGPLNDGDRTTLLASVESAAVYNRSALSVLDCAREDSTGAICAEAAMGWVETKVNDGPLTDGDVQWLVSELGALGPEFQMRRTAAALGLIIAGHPDRFVDAESHDKKPLDVEANPGLTRNDLFIRRLEDRWDEITTVFGSEKAALERFAITPERTLRYMQSRQAKGSRLLRLMLAQAPTAPHVYRQDIIFALAQVEPNAVEVRNILVSLFQDRTETLRRSNAEHWGILKAGELFAEHFAEDEPLRQLALEALDADPGHEASTVALAELMLRKPDTEIIRLMQAKTVGIKYPIGAFFKLTAALSGPEVFADEMERIFSASVMQTPGIQYWLPALLRRIRMDEKVQEELFGDLSADPELAIKVPLAAVLGRALGPSSHLRQFANTELEKLEALVPPQIAFDVTAQAWRPVWQILTELAA